MFRDVDADVPALLEWVNLLYSNKVVTHEVSDISELADGKELLRVMHDLSPDIAPSVENCGNRYLVPLLEGLEIHFSGSESPDTTCSQLLEEAKTARSVDPILLVKLVLVATVQNDLDKRRFYVEVMCQLSHRGMQAAKAVVERFTQGDGLESPPARYLQVQDDASAFGSQVGFSPPSRRARAADSAKVDWREPGLDADTRFEALKEEYIAVVEDVERLSEERQGITEQLETERKRRIAAEEKERAVLDELQAAEQARDVAREELRQLAHNRHDLKAADLAARLQQMGEELETNREELALSRQRAATADKLHKQVEAYKQKMESMQSLRRENEELKTQIDEMMARPNAAAGGEHMQRSLARARENAISAVRDRDDAQQQLLMVRELLAKEQVTRHELTKELQSIRSGVASIQGTAAETPASTNQGAARNFGPDMSSFVAAPTNLENMSVNMSVSAQSDMLERLLSEKERATRAETTLQVKSADLSALEDKRERDLAKIASLEAQIAVLQSRGVGTGQDADQRVQELRSQIALRDQQLQVLQLRETAEKDCLRAQGTLMAASFHEIGLRYHKLRLRSDLEATCRQAEQQQE